MAEKPSQLKQDDSLDPIARAAGARSENDPFMERYSSDISDSDVADLELSDSTDDQPEETEHIKAQIEETRSQLGETIDAIQEKLSFSNVSEQVSEQVSNAIESAKDSVYDATIGKAVYFMKSMGEDISGSRMVRTVQSNPFPLVLIGLGAGLLAYQTYGRSSSRRPIRGLGKYQGGGYGRGRNFADRPNNTETSGDRESMTTRAYDGISETAGSAVSSVTNAAGSAYETVSHKVGDVYSGAGDMANRAYQSVGELGSKAQEQYEYYLEENPLAVGAVAAALGAAVGFAIPSTRYESQLMGESRQQLMGMAQSKANDFIDQAKRVADEAGKTIKDEAKALTQ